MNYKTNALLFCKTKVTDLWVYIRHEVSLCCCCPASVTNAPKTTRVQFISSSMQKTDMFSRTEGNKHKKGYVATCRTSVGKTEPQCLHTLPVGRSTRPTSECTLLHKPWVFQFSFDVCHGKWLLGASKGQWHWCPGMRGTAAMAASQGAQVGGLASQGAACAPWLCLLQSQTALTQGRTRDCPGLCPPQGGPTSSELGNSPEVLGACRFRSWSWSFRSQLPALPEAEMLGPPCPQVMLREWYWVSIHFLSAALT